MVTVRQRLEWIERYLKDAQLADTRGRDSDVEYAVGRLCGHATVLQADLFTVRQQERAFHESGDSGHDTDNQVNPDCQDPQD